MSHSGAGEPSDADDRTQRLAHAPAVDDTVGPQALQRADRGAVVAELGVVVVLDDQRVVRSRPLPERDAPLRREHGAERE